MPNLSSTGAFQQEAICPASLARVGPLDRFIKETLRCRAYVRYMDDFVVWASARQELKAVRGQIALFVAEQLGLELKPEPMQFLLADPMLCPSGCAKVRSEDFVEVEFQAREANGP